MNAKQCKRLRKAVGNPRARAYERHELTGQIRLHPECGRALYQFAKRAQS